MCHPMEPDKEVWVEEEKIQPGKHRTKKAWKGRRGGGDLFFFYKNRRIKEKSYKHQAKSSDTS